MAIADRTRDSNRLFHDIICEIEISKENEPYGLRPGPAADAWDRFKLWVGNIGANHQSASLLSLESRLAGADELIQEVLDLLEDLTDALTELYEILRGHQENRTVAPIQNLALYEDSISGDEQSAEIATPVTDSHSEAQGLLGAVNECIRSLFRISILIARTTPRDRFARAQSNRRTFFIDGFDINYVEERYPKLSGPENAWLRKRLGRANTKRRQFIRYCHRHRETLAGEPSQIRDVKGFLPLAIMNDEKPNMAKEQVLPTPAATKPIAKFLDMVSDTAHTKPSTKASTFDLEMLREDVGVLEEDDTKSYTSAASSANLDAEKYLELPRLADVNDGNDTFECPFCCTIKKFTRERSWRKHAYEDLRAYVCTAGGTECDDELFGDRKTWFNHESQRHRSQWTCIICHDQYFGTHSLLRDHSVSQHPDMEPDAIESLVSAGQRPLQVIPAADCPFCDEWEKALRSSLADSNTNVSTTTDDVIVVEAKQFRQHVASHLQQLALFSIPRGISDDATEGYSSDAAQQSVSSRSNLGRNTKAGTEETVAQEIWNDPDPPLQKVIARGDLIEMFRMLLGGDVDPNTIGDSWGTAMDAAQRAPWDSYRRDRAFETLREHGGLFLKELLEEGTGDEQGETEDYQIDADDTSISMEMDYRDHPIEIQVELEEGTANKQGGTEDQQVDADEVFFLQEKWRFRDTPDPLDRSGAMAPRPQTPETDTAADLASTAPAASQPSRRPTPPWRQPPLAPATPPEINKLVRISEDIFQIQSALASFGYRYHAPSDPVHSRILAFLAREHPRAATDFPKKETQSLRDILNDMARWKTVFYSDTEFTDSTSSSDPPSSESQLDEEQSAERIDSTTSINIERFREILTTEFPKHTLPEHLVLRLHRPLKDDIFDSGPGRDDNFKGKGMTWDNFVYTMLLIRAVTTTFDQDATSESNGFKSFHFEDFVLAMLEIVELQTAIQPDFVATTTSASADPWASTPDGESVLGESLAETLNTNT